MNEPWLPLPNWSSLPPFKSSFCLSALLWQRVSTVLPNCPCPEAMISSLLRLTRCVIPPFETYETCQCSEAGAAASFVLSSLAVSFPNLEYTSAQVLTRNPSQSYLDKSYSDMHINIMTYCCNHGIPNILTLLSLLWHEWLPCFVRLSVAFLRRWMGVWRDSLSCLFHLPISYFQLRSPGTLHTPEYLLICNTGSLSSSVSSSCVESPGVASELPIQPVLPPALQVTFLNRGNVWSVALTLHSCFSGNVSSLHPCAK